jgi:exo-beta-1,3-glucanase (GH17 family)
MMSLGRRAVLILALLLVLLFGVSVWLQLSLMTSLLVVLPQKSLATRTASHSRISFVSPAVAYHPRRFVLGAESSTPSREQVQEDLYLLRTNGFRSLVTYGARGVLGAIPAIARQTGFDGSVIMGIWDPFSEEEWANAVTQIAFVDGYCLGNEGLGIRYTPETLAIRMEELRRVTGKPVTTTEPIDSYLDGPYRAWLLAHSDWLFPLAQPFLAAQLDPIQAVHWIVARRDYLVALSGMNVILKEAGFPSAGADGGTEDAQRGFFAALNATELPFFHFEAFDQPWKRDVLGHPEVEAHWGLYRADGTPKQVILWLADHWAP